MEYFNPNETASLFAFSKSIRQLIEKKEKYHAPRDIVFVCIGSDRATGDCLGPIIGRKLSRYHNQESKRNFHVYGTLENPVHAKNLEAAIHHIHFHHPDAIIIAIDASLGIVEHIGYVTLGEGALCPGSGVAKELPEIGDLFITGIVNLSGFGGQMLLQTTHLNLVMKLADFITLGLYRSLHHSKFCPSLQRAE